MHIRVYSMYAMHGMVYDIVWTILIRAHLFYQLWLHILNALATPFPYACMLYATYMTV